MRFIFEVQIITGASGNAPPERSGARTARHERDAAPIERAQNRADLAVECGITSKSGELFSMVHPSHS